MKHGSATDRDDDALHWAWRLDQEPASEALSSELANWLSANPLHSGALLRAQAHLQLAGSAIRARQAPRVRKLWPLLATAAVLAVLGIGLWLSQRSSLAHPARYATATGEIRQVPLPDGSTAAINTQSSIEVSSESHQRTVTLVKGEAWFRVARDPSRPFVVQVGTVRVRALGTAFSVRRTAQGADVLVTEGSVETWVQGAQRQVTRMGAGTKASIAATAVIAPSPTRHADIDRQLAWREGRIDLEGDTLGQAVEEFNRYNERKIVISTPELSSERLYGVFRTDDPEGFANAVKRSLGATASADEREIRIAR